MNKLLPIIFCFFCFVGTGQVTFWTDDFDSGAPTSGSRVATGHGSPAEGTICSAGDYFVRTSEPGFNTQPDGMGATFTGFSGSYWRGEHTTSCITNPEVLNYSINISGQTALDFSGSFACRTVSYEAGDQILIEYQIDGGGFTTGLDIRQNAAGTNFAVDTDGDLVGDGPDITEAFSVREFAIPGTGTTLDIRITCTTGGSEEFGFENFNVRHSSPLPIELGKFEARKQETEVKLEWVTITENNNEYFSVEHSSDGERFESIGIIEGAGDSFEPINYSFMHTKPSQGLNYYRLMQVDFDSKFSYSDIKVVDFNRNSTFEFSPNPFTDEVTIKLEKAYLKDTQFNVFNMQGQLVYTGIIPADQLQEVVNLSSIPSGAYTLRIGFGEEAISQRIVKF